MAAAHSSGYDFTSDRKFVEDNYADISWLHRNKTIVVKDCIILFVFDTSADAFNKVSVLGISGKCSVYTITGNYDRDLGPVYI